jgi:hypothetical protein
MRLLDKVKGGIERVVKKAPEESERPNAKREVNVASTASEARSEVEDTRSMDLPKEKEGP